MLNYYNITDNFFMNCQIPNTRPIQKLHYFKHSAYLKILIKMQKNPFLELNSINTLITAKMLEAF